ncbi:hypothetical protein ACU635_28845 [[Actinomadura] parvosata]|uniref:hypothetical protein n=1 Tax=[Actinomadura] parvosata TaxID=1955412 RepID=UPI00406D1E7D
MLRSLAVAAALVPAIALTGPAAGAALRPQLDIERSQTDQTIDGFGYSTVFQRATLVHHLSPAEQAEALGLRVPPSPPSLPLS